eukprot:478673_1
MSSKTVLLITRGNENTQNLSDDIRRIVSSFKKNEIDLSPERVSGIEYLLSLDLSYMNERMIYDKDFANHDECNKAIIEYKKFLIICFYLWGKSEFIVPCTAVDKVWHHHVFDMRQYHMDCMRIFGFIIFHNPRYKIPIEEYPSFQEPYYNKVLTSYHKIFGYGAPKMIWNESAISGGGTTCSYCGEYECREMCRQTSNNQSSSSNKNTESTCCGCVLL